ncbi:MAG: PLDc_N domain-containing protein [Thermomicrobiales bacterium]|nr:PLDc_N domain-containing protein [Thermomicrobiales bacterium]
MDWQTFFLLVAILTFAVAYYGLAYLAIRDLLRRPAVRGQNKVIWALVILCLPVLGALFYGYMGATSFVPRTRSAPPGRPESKGRPSD